MNRKVFSLLSVLALISCSEHEMLTAPQPTLAPARPRNLSATLPGFQGWLSGIPGSTLTLDPYPYAEGVRVAFSITGSIDIGSNGTYAYYVTRDWTLDAAGIYVSGAYTQCSLRASATFKGSGLVPQKDFGPPRTCVVPRTMGDYTDTAVVSGTGTAVRDVGVSEPSPGPCDTILCHTYGGSQLVTVTPLEADLDMKASYLGKTGRTIFVAPFTHSDGYRTIAFTDSTTPKGYPIQPFLRTWVRADPTAPGDSWWGHTNINNCPNGNYQGTPPTYPSTRCDLDVKESGKLISMTRVNGVVHTDSACVQCATNDSILDNQVVRMKLMQISDSSFGKGPVSNRKEHVIVILQDTVTHVISTVDMPTTYADQCQSNWSYINNFNYIDSTQRIIAYAHVHPQYQNEPYACIGRAPTSGAPGGGTDDWATLRRIVRDNFYTSRGWRPPMYIIANDNVYKMDAAKGPGPDQKAIMRWDIGICAWVRL